MTVTTVYVELDGLCVGWCSPLTVGAPHSGFLGHLPTTRDRAPARPARSRSVTQAKKWGGRASSAAMIHRSATAYDTVIRHDLLPARRTGLTPAREFAEVVLRAARAAGT